MKKKKIDRLADEITDRLFMFPGSNEEADILIKGFRLPPDRTTEEGIWRKPAVRDAIADFLSGRKG